MNALINSFIIKQAMLETLDGLTDQIPRLDPNPPSEDTSSTHLLWMILHACQNLDKWPIDKTNRWIGYIQGVATARGWITSAAERERTRPIFHKAYAAMGHDIPATAEPQDLTYHQRIDPDSNQ